MTDTQATQKTTTSIGKLPVWDKALNDLYKGMDAPELKSDIADLERETKAFNERLIGKVGTLDGKALAEEIRKYEKMQERLCNIFTYARLLRDVSITDPAAAKFDQEMQETVNRLSIPLIFFTLEINRISDANMAEKLKDASLSHYAPWLRNVRVFKPYQLSDELEKLFHEKNLTAFTAWNRLYDETLASLQFPLRRKKLTLMEAHEAMMDKDEAKRKEIAKAMTDVLNANMRIFSTVTNTLAKDKEIEDKWRGFKTPVSYRNTANFVEDEVVEALVSSVRASYPRLSHRYYALKAKWLGKDALDYWDRNAPLPEDEDRKVPWNEARETVLNVYTSFSEEMGKIAKQFFDKQWIDAKPRKGKTSSQYMWTSSPGIPPYILISYMGKVRDVATLAHEVGHGIHHFLACKQGLLMSETPLTLCETASVFGENLTFKFLMQKETNPKVRKVMLAKKVEDMLNTVVRQIAFFEFEKRVHAERRREELTADRICEIWMETQRESFGNSIKLGDDYKPFWVYISHFIHHSFYVYAYAFGDCLVNSLYSVYEKEAAAGRGAEFAKKYVELLSAGGTKWHKELLAPFGLNAADPNFWQQGLGVLNGYIDELEKM